MLSFLTFYKKIGRLHCKFSTSYNWIYDILVAHYRTWWFSSITRQYLFLRVQKDLETARKHHTVNCIIFWNLPLNNVFLLNNKHLLMLQLRVPTTAFTADIVYLICIPVFKELVSNQSVSVIYNCLVLIGT